MQSLLHQVQRVWWPEVDIRPAALALGPTVLQQVRYCAPAVRWRHGASARAFHPRCCLGLERENSRSARQARWTSLFGVDLWRANETKKARSVVALSRVPR